MTRIIVIAVLILSLAGAACSRSDRNEGAVPRRYAYPRFEPYDSTSVAVRIGDVEFRVNKAAEVERKSDAWADLRFPRYGATLHLTYSRTHGEKDMREALANRRQRMTLNLGEAPGESTQYMTQAGFVCEEIYAPEAIVTPLQFTATDRGGRMLSGAVVFGGKESIDSVAPILDALADEVRRMLTTLTPVK